MAPLIAKLPAKFSILALKLIQGCAHHAPKMQYYGSRSLMNNARRRSATVELDAEKVLPRTKQRLVPPHVFVFAFLCLLYFLPLWLISGASFEQGGILAVGVDAHLVMGKIITVYLLGFTFYALGSWSVPKLCWLLGAKSDKRLEIVPLHLYKSDAILMVLLACSFTLSKVLLIPAGVYSTYFFDSEAGSSPVWTASMFLSDAMVLASLIALFSNSRRHLLMFFSISILNGINLLHGTRNFFVIAILAIGVYAYARSKASVVKLVLYGVVGFVGAIVLAYGVFISRSHVADAGFSALDLLSPITFESVFSQMSLVTILNHIILVPEVPNPIHFFHDVVLFTMPRFFLPDKESGLWIIKFGNLSPLGAFNGFAAGLLYFGYFFPVFYYLIGVATGLLYRWSTNQYGAILFLYTTSDLLYRITRDGYIIPAKMFINTIGMIFVLAIGRSVGQYAERFRRNAKHKAAIVRTSATV